MYQGVLGSISVWLYQRYYIGGACLPSPLQSVDDCDTYISAVLTDDDSCLFYSNVVSLLVFGFVFSHIVFLWYIFCVQFGVITSAFDRLEPLVSEMTCCVPSGTLTTAHTLVYSLGSGSVYLWVSLPI